MLHLKTFRARLIFYILLISTFLSIALGTSFWHVRDILLEESNNQLSRTANLLDTYLVAEQRELERYANIVRDDLRIQEYMYIVTEIGAERGPLDKLLSEQFGWLPIDNNILTDKSGKIIGGHKTSVITDITQHHGNTPGVKLEYVNTNNGFELVACAPVYYLEQLLGYIVISRSYDTVKLRELENISKGRVFITLNNTISLSTIPSAINKSIDPQKLVLSLLNDSFFLRQVNLSDNAGQQSPAFYFGVSEVYLLETIHDFSRLTFATVVIGVLSILLLGMFFLRDFDRPIKELLSVTDAVAQGKLPTVNKIVPRNEIDALSNRFADMVQSLREQQTLISKAHSKLETLAITDTLTNLYNRRHLLEVFPKLQAQAQRDGTSLAAIIIDIDHFKDINDEHGHLAGDQCLMEFSALLRSHSRTNDYLFRLGGEEFLIVTLGENVEGVYAAAEKIRKATEQTPVQYGKTDITMTISCGICVEHPTGTKEESLNRLLHHSDNALYLAKQTGRNKVIVHLHEDETDQQGTA